MRRAYLLWLITVAILAVVGVACAAPPAAPPAAAPEQEQPAAQPTRVEELKVGQFGDPVTLDCWDWTAVDELDILQHFAEPLFRFDRDGNITGAIAESWEMKSPTEWIIRIRKGIKFHDPEYGELTAEDVVASQTSSSRMRS